CGALRTSGPVADLAGMMRAAGRAAWPGSVKRSEAKLTRLTTETVTMLRTRKRDRDRRTVAPPHRGRGPVSRGGRVFRMSRSDATPKPPRQARRWADARPDPVR